MNGLEKYPNVRKWLEPWLWQLQGVMDGEYAVLVSELVEEPGTAQYQRTLGLLDSHLAIGCEVCLEFGRCLAEKRKLPTELDSANTTVLDKLAEVRAVVGLHRLGFRKIEFLRTPDFAAVLDGKRFLVEVTRLGSSVGRRADVWDSKWGSMEAGAQIGVAYGGGRSVDAISDAIYREIEDKCGQLKKSVRHGERGMLWISLGRDYFTAGKYELPGVGLLLRMSNPSAALARAVGQIRATGLYTALSRVVLSLGRDEADLAMAVWDTHEQGS